MEVGSPKDEARKAALEVQGFTSVREGELLFDLAVKGSALGSIVEIGSWKGRSTIWLAKGSLEGSRSPVYAVDPHVGGQEHIEENIASTYEEFIANVRRARVTEVVVPLTTTSQEAVKEVKDRVGLLFLDGEKEYEEVKADLEAWLPKMSRGSYVVLHDTEGTKGPRKVAYDVLYRSGKFRKVRMLDTVTYGEYVRENTVLDNAMNHALLTARRAAIFMMRFDYPPQVRAMGRRALEMARSWGLG